MLKKKQRKDPYSLYKSQTHKHNENRVSISRWPQKHMWNYLLCTKATRIVGRYTIPSFIHLVASTALNNEKRDEYHIRTTTDRQILNVENSKESTNKVTAALRIRVCGVRKSGTKRRIWRRNTRIQRWCQLYCISLRRIVYRAYQGMMQWIVCAPCGGGMTTLH